MSRGGAKRILVTGANAVLRHLSIAQADVAGYSHGGDAAIRMAIQHPEMVRPGYTPLQCTSPSWSPRCPDGSSACESAARSLFRFTG